MTKFIAGLESKSRYWKIGHQALVLQMVKTHATHKWNLTGYTYSREPPLPNLNQRICRKSRRAVIKGGVSKWGARLETLAHWVVCINFWGAASSHIDRNQWHTKTRLERVTRRPLQQRLQWTASSHLKIQELQHSTPPLWPEGKFWV